MRPSTTVVLVSPCSCPTPSWPTHHGIQLRAFILFPFEVFLGVRLRSLLESSKPGGVLVPKWQRHATLPQALVSFRDIADFCTSMRPSCFVRPKFSSHHETISGPPISPHACTRAVLAHVGALALCLCYALETWGKESLFLALPHLCQSQVSAVAVTHHRVLIPPADLAAAARAARHYCNVQRPHGCMYPLGTGTAYHP
jgi:hypothetical protein